MPFSSEGMATSRRSLLRLFLRFEFGATMLLEAVSAASAASEEGKGSTAMECERCFCVAIVGGNIWMDGIAPMKGDGPVRKVMRRW